jgi:hypothetical protein
MVTINIDYTYYYSLYDFDTKYYKLYDKYIYDNEKIIIDLFNGIISVNEFELADKKFEYQILGDYYKYFRYEIDKASEYYDKAIKAGNNICKIKNIITKYKKGTDNYYKALFTLLPEEPYACEYISNLFIYCNDIQIINKYIEKIINYIKNPNKYTKYYYLLKSAYEYYIKDYKAYVNTVKDNIKYCTPITICNFISNYYNTDKELVWKLVNDYFSNNNGYNKKNDDNANSIIYINLFIVCKLENRFDESIKYLIKAINGYNKNEYFDILYIISNTDYNSLLDILFDNFHLVNLNTTYLELIDFRLLNLLVNYYYKLDPILYKYNYDFIQFYKNKLLNVYSLIKQMQKERLINDYIKNEDLDINFPIEIINASGQDIRYKDNTILDYLINLFIFISRNKTVLIG